MLSMDDYVFIGKIVKTHGIKGELRIKSDFDKKELVFQPGFTLYIGKGYVPEEIVSYRKHKDFDMVIFKGYDNINQVLHYLKMDVYVKRESLSLKEDDYLLQDLIGFTVLENGEILGKVSDIVYNGSSILLYIASSQNFYIPYQNYFVKKVILEKHVIEVENAKGLIL